jgi:hypothetical protein
VTEQEWKKLRKEANKKSDDAYSTEVSNIIRLTKSEVDKLVAEAKVDKAKLAELMTVVNAAAKSNRQKANMIRNTEGLAEMAVAILKTVS